MFLLINESRKLSSYP